MPESGPSHDARANLRRAVRVGLDHQPPNGAPIDPEDREKLEELLSDE